MPHQEQPSSISRETVSGPRVDELHAKTDLVLEALRKGDCFDTNEALNVLGLAILSVWKRAIERNNMPDPGMVALVTLIEGIIESNYTHVN